MSTSLIAPMYNELKRQGEHIAVIAAANIARNFILGLSGPSDGPLLEDWLQNSNNMAGFNQVVLDEDGADDIISLYGPINAICNSITASPIVLSNTSFRTKLLASGSGAGALANNQPSMDVVAASTAIMSAVVASTVAMDAVAASQVALMAFFGAATPTPPHVYDGAWQSFITSEGLRIGRPNTSTPGGVFVWSMMFDLTNYNTLSLTLRKERVNGTAMYELIKVGGTNVRRDNTSGGYSWTTFTYDVSALSGLQPIEVGWEFTSSGFTGEFWLDTKKILLT